MIQYRKGLCVYNGMESNSLLARSMYVWHLLAIESFELINGNRVWFSTERVKVSGTAWNWTVYVQEVCSWHLLAIELIPLKHIVTGVSATFLCIISSFVLAVWRIVITANWKTELLCLNVYVKSFLQFVTIKQNSHQICSFCHFLVPQCNSTRLYLSCWGLQYHRASCPSPPPPACPD